MPLSVSRLPRTTTQAHCIPPLGFFLTTGIVLVCHAVQWKSNKQQNSTINSIASTTTTTTLLLLAEYFATIYRQIACKTVVFKAGKRQLKLYITVVKHKACFQLNILFIFYFIIILRLALFVSLLLFCRYHSSILCCCIISIIIITIATVAVAVTVTVVVMYTDYVIALRGKVVL